MEKLNIAELLKDCPKGIKLYSPIFGDVYLEKIRPHLVIVVTTDKEQGDFKEEFLYDGRYGINGECMLFPSKGKTTWEGFQRPFKNGDTIVYDNSSKPSKDMEEKDKAKAPNLKGEDYSGKRYGYKIPDGYEFDTVDNGKIILKPIKFEYPKTYKECCDVLLIPPYYNLRYHTYEPNYDEYATSNTLLSLEDKLNTLGKLLICCNAYWKIAGEQMGLGKPWDSVYGCGEWGYWIEYDINANKIYCQDSRILLNRLLVFPSEEMRDTFYENFKDLIEQCKELL
jgi:hypothetical protein